jgi:hypothetical protein
MQTFPPKVHFLLLTYPTQCPLYTINRRLPRCINCDLADTRRQVFEAEAPVTEVQNEIAVVDELVRKELQTSILMVELMEMQERLWIKERDRDEKVKRAWEWFWGVWGKIEDQ